LKFKQAAIRSLFFHHHFFGKREMNLSSLAKGIGALNVTRLLWEKTLFSHISVFLMFF